MKRTARKIGPRRYISEDRVNVVARFHELKKAGLSAERAAKKLRKSTATIYRWRRELDVKQASDALASSADELVSAAISTLVAPASVGTISALEALFTFFSWLRWPSRRADLNAAVTVCVVNYVSQKTEAIRVIDTDQEYQKLIMKYLSLSDLQRMSSQDSVYYPYFDAFMIDSQPFDERDYLSYVVWYFLGYRSVLGYQAAKPSLKQFHSLCNDNKFRYIWKISLRTFRRVWADHGVAAPFYYVERLALGPDFAIDPKHLDFAKHIDEILSDRPSLISYFQRCKWVIDQLRSELDPRAYQRLSFPTLPADLKPLEEAVESLPHDVKAALNSAEQAR